jgi:DNA-binding transcriptional LysR family regulator
LTPDELLLHDCIIDWRSGHRHSWLLRNSAGKTEAYDIPVRYEMGDGEAVLAAALAGLGLVQAPTWLVSEQLESGALIPVLNDQSGGEMPINLIWARSQHMQLKLRVVIDALLSAAQESGSGFRAM